MFSFSANFADDNVGVEDAKVMKLVSTFNNKNSLEFVLGRDKRFLKLANTELVMEIELPASYVPDNDFGSKLFENCEVSINHEIVTKKSTALDYAVTNWVLNKTAFDNSYVESTMDINGWYDKGSFDKVEYLQTHMDRTKTSEKFNKIIEHNGDLYYMPMVRYFLTIPLNTGLARVTDVLPADCVVNIRFQRAPSKFGILKISDTVVLIKKSDNSEHETEFSYDEAVIPIKNPYLSVYYANSTELQSHFSRVGKSSLEIPFLGKFELISLFKIQMNI